MEMLNLLPRKTLQDENMKKIFLTTTIVLFFNGFWSFQANAGDDPKYPGYDFEPKVIYRSPELLEKLAPKPVSTPKAVSQKNKQQKSTYPAKTKPEKPKQTNATSTNLTSAAKQDSGLPFKSIFMIALILAAVWFVYLEVMSVIPAEITKAKPFVKTRKLSAATQKKNEGSDILVLSDNIEQCQASTSKGTRCKRNTNLQLKRHTVNQRNCQFAVCKQHDSNSFIPHPSVVKNV